MTWNKAGLAGMILAAAQLAAGMTPTQADLDAALEKARTAWATPVDNISIVAENPCVLLAAGAAGARTYDETLAYEQHVESELRVIDEETGMVTVSDFSSPHIIRVNVACNWSRAWLERTVIHEYGHALGLHQLAGGVSN